MARIEYNKSLLKNNKRKIQELLKPSIDEFGQKEFLAALKQEGIVMSSSDLSKKMSTKDSCLIHEFTFTELEKIQSILGIKIISFDEKSHSIDVNIVGEAASAIKLGGRIFKGYLGKYYCYYLSTETNSENIMVGDITFDNKEGLCCAELTVNFQEVQSQYVGKLAINQELGVCYCILFGCNSGELNMLTFEYEREIGMDRVLHFFSTVSTISAGKGGCRPTIHRMFFSRKVLSSQQITECIMPMLKLNTEKILISSQKFETLLYDNRNLITPVLEKAFKSSISVKEEYCEISEKSILAKIDDNIAYKMLSLFRANSISANNNKISRHLKEYMENLVDFSDLR